MPVAGSLRSAIRRTRETARSRPKTSPATRWRGPVVLGAVIVATLNAGVVSAVSLAAGSPGHRARPAGHGTPPSPPASDVPVAPVSFWQRRVAPLHHLREADVLVTAYRPVSQRALAKIRRLHGVTAVEVADGARLRVAGKKIDMIGVDPSTFRAFTPEPTASADAVWQNIADGAIVVSYRMGRDDRLPLGGTVEAAGRQRIPLTVGAFATAGMGGIDAMVSRETARRLGLPAGNVLVVSAPDADPVTLQRELAHLVPHGAAVIPLTGAYAPVRGAGGSLSRTQIITALTAAESKLGRPYVWGAAGPSSFDCSGLVQWAFGQAGIRMPRVAAEQYLTGPRIPVDQARPGDLLFWRTDPTAPEYVSHVAIYLGHGMMIVAPHTGDVVRVEPVRYGPGFAGVVRVDPRRAAALAS